MSLPPGATLVSGQLPDTQALPPGATLVSGSLPPPSLYDRTVSAVKDFASRVAHPIAPTMEQMQEANIGAGKFGAETMMGQEIAGPVAKAVESTVIPAAKAIPFVGRAVDAINQAPTLFGKALGGATVGGGTGAVEGFIRGKSPAEIASEAGKGALYGGALGLALPLMSKLAQTGGPGTFAARPRPFADYEAPPEVASAPQGNPTPFTPATSAQTAVAPKVEGPIPPPKKLTLGPGEDTGIGLGNDHIITNAQGDRVGSIQVEQKPNDVAHVHWMGGDFSDYGRQPVVAAIKEAYPEAETITYDRRRLAKGATAATTQPRQMNIAQAPSVDDVVNQATGNKPLAPNVPLKEQAVAPKSEPPASSSGVPTKESYEAETKMAIAPPGDIMAKLAFGNEQIVSRAPAEYSYTNPKGKTYNFDLIHSKTPNGMDRYMMAGQGPYADQVYSGAILDKNGNLSTIHTDPMFRNIGLGSNLIKAIEKETGASLQISPETSVSKAGAGVMQKAAGITAPVETDPLKVKYPNPAQRQMVRANGERIVQAVGGDADTMKAVHDLTRVDLRQAAINHGIDMGQTTVSNSKFAGEGSITRENMFNRLLDEGLKPQDIVRLAKQPVAQ